MTKIALINLRTNALRHPAAIVGNPTFSWAFSGHTDRELDRGIVRVFDSTTGERVWQGSWEGDFPRVTYSGKPLTPSHPYRWQITVQTGPEAEVSASAEFETSPATLDPAQWIALPVTEDADHPTRVQYLRTEFVLPAEPVRARAYVTALGWYGLFANGHDITGNSITPRFTALDHRVEYAAYDLTDHLHRGHNAIGIQLAEGRYRGRNSAVGVRAIYGNQLAALALLEVDCANGSTVRIYTDDSWTGGTGPIITADPQDGVVIDYRLPGGDWTTPGTAFDAEPVTTFPQTVTVVPTTSQQVTTTGEILAVSITEAGSNVVVDFGQNLNGVARLTVTRASGQNIAVSYSELLDAAGHVDFMYLDTGGAIPRIDAIDHFIPADDRQVLEPRYTIRGFRYIEIEGITADQLESATALPIGADLDYSGSFDSSHPLLNRLEQNIRWSMRSNFSDVPTDCPTRERSGWTGDAQIFTATAALLADVQPMLTDWLRDIALQQDDEGTVLDIVPRDAFHNHDMAETMPGKGSAGWGDAIVMIPWDLYQSTCDPAVLAENWDAMVRWVERTRRVAAGKRNPNRSGDPQPHEQFIVDTGFHYGEWLEPGNEPGADGTPMMEAFLGLSRNPDAEVATAYFAHSTNLLARIASVLGKHREAEEYETLWKAVRNAYQAEFLDVTGHPKVISQAKLVRPLTFGLLPEDAEQGVADLLAAEVRANGTRLATGFLSTGYLLPALSNNGYEELALDLLLQEQAPSWLNQVQRGATTILESWEGLGSQNHYSLGAVAQWMYQSLAGIKQEAPGWSAVAIQPILTERLDHVSASIVTPFGRIRSAWKRTDAGWNLQIEVPPGAESVLRIVLGHHHLEEVQLPAGLTDYRVTDAPQPVLLALARS